jgi:hypothetical protein
VNVAVLLVMSVSAAQFLDRVERFHEHWNKFMRAYMGCPLDAIQISECRPERAQFDYAEFLKAARAARELFELKAAD